MSLQFLWDITFTSTAEASLDEYLNRFGEQISADNYRGGKKMKIVSVGSGNIRTNMSNVSFQVSDGKKSLRRGETSSYRPAVRWLPMAGSHTSQQWCLCSDWPLLLHLCTWTQSYRLRVFVGHHVPPHLVLPWLHVKPITDCSHCGSSDGGRSYQLSEQLQKHLDLLILTHPTSTNCVSDLISLIK